MLTKEEIDYYLSDVVMYNCTITDVFRKIHKLALSACNSECMDEYYRGMHYGELHCGYGENDFDDEAAWESGLTVLEFFNEFGIPYSKEDELLLKRRVWCTEKVLNFEPEACLNSEGAPAFILRNTLTYTVNKEN